MGKSTISVAMASSSQTVSHYRRVYPSHFNISDTSDPVQEQIHGLLEIWWSALGPGDGRVQRIIPSTLLQEEPPVEATCSCMGLWMFMIYDGYIMDLKLNIELHLGLGFMMDT